MKRRNMELVQSAMCIANVKNVSRPKPSLFFYPGLNSKPIYEYEHGSVKSRSLESNLLWIANVLKQNYSSILSEYENLRIVQPSGDYKLLIDEHKLHNGESWEWNSYILKGKRQASFASTCPKTVEILESFQSPSLMTDVPFSYAFFSTLGRNTSIASHYGPCNLRIRCHFPLVIPSPHNGTECGMLLANQKIQWHEQKAIFFDDTYQHSG